MKPTHKKISATIHKWVREMIVDCKCANLNELVTMGYCGDLAHFLWELFDRNNKHFVWHDCDSPCHVWIEFDGLHYDMQNPDGVSSQAEMEYFKLESITR